MSLHTHTFTIWKPGLLAGLVFVFLFVITGITHAQNYDETITSFYSNVEIFESGDIRVQEVINYDFADNERRGIFREIPLDRVPGNNAKLDIDLISVTDEQGVSYSYQVDSYSPFSVRIGNPDVYLTGEHTYAITYDVKNAVGSFKDFDELYWNITGNEWEAPILYAESRIVLPVEISEQDLRLASYCGDSGSKDPCNGSPVVAYQNGKTIITTIHDPVITASYMGMTVAVVFPKNIVESSFWLWALLSRFWFYPMPILVVMFWFRKRFSYWLRRRKFYQDNTIVVEYDAGENDPLEAVGMLEGSIPDSALAAHVIYLAIHGYVTISEEDDEYVFTGTDKKYDDLPPYSRELLEGIVGKRESELRQSFYTTASSVQQLASSSLSTRDYVLKMKQGVKGARPVTLFISFFLAVNPGAFVWVLLGPSFGFIFSASSVLIGLITVILGSTRPHLSDKGLHEERKLLGLKQYIELAEKDRIDFHNDPEKGLATFEKLLPYAMVFGLEKKWAKQFEGLAVQPNWYHGSSVNQFSAMTLATSLSHFSAHTTKSMFAAPFISRSGSSFSSGSSSFSGGSSGGGSSGGGGGGGGGGSW